MKHVYGSDKLAFGNHANVRVWLVMLILVVFDVKQVRFQTGSVIRFAESKFSKEAASAVRTRLVVIGQTWEGEGRRVCGVLGVECEICVFVELADEVRLDRNK